jgi:hypothetical protein
MMTLEGNAARTGFHGPLSPKGNSLVRCLAGLFLLAAGAQAQRTNDSISPSSGSGPNGAIQAFTAKYSDSLGATEISETDLDINTSAIAVAGCSIKYSDWSNGLYLANDNRTSGLARSRRDRAPRYRTANALSMGRAVRFRSPAPS